MGYPSGGDDFDQTIIDWLAAGLKVKKGLIRKDPMALQRV